MNNKCTVLINSCDKYEDAWYPFFELIKKYWNECEYPFVLNTETKNYKHTGVNLEVIKIESKSEKWGSRLINSLNKIESEYVILLLEDFFLLGPVDYVEIERCIQWMNIEKNIAAIYFKKIAGFVSDKKSDVLNDYILMEENKRYKLNLQAGLWNREKLISLIQDEDTPWSFEEIGYKRLENLNYKFYCSAVGSHYNTEKNVFKYLVARDFGYGIWKGKWLWNNDKLLKSKGIEVRKVKMNRMSKYQYLILKIKYRLNHLLKRKISMD